MSHYTSLKTEILKPEYAGMTDEQIAAAVNVKRMAVPTNINPSVAVNALIFTPTGDWGQIVGVAEGVINKAASRVACISVRELLRRTEPFEASNETYWALFLSTCDALVAASIMSATGRAAMVALGRPDILLWSYWGFPEPVTAGDVNSARLYG